MRAIFVVPHRHGEVLVEQQACDESRGAQHESTEDGDVRAEANRAQTATSASACGQHCPRHLSRPGIEWRIPPDRPDVLEGIDDVETRDQNRTTESSQTVDRRGRRD